MGDRVTTLVTLRRCTLGNKREIKTLKFVLASTKGFSGGLGLDQALQERHGSDFFLLLAWGCAPPVGRVRCVRVPGGGLGGGGGGGGPCAVPPVCAAGGASRAGGRSASFRPSAFPGQATKRVSLASFWSWGAWPPYRSGSCSPAFSGRDLCGVLARWRGLACSPRFLWEPAAGAGGRAVLRLLSRAGGGGTIPPASGGWGRRPRGLRAGGGGGGGGRAAASLLSLWGAARGSLPWPPSCRRRTPPRRARSVGVAGPPRWGGGMRGGPWTAPPWAPSDLNPPSALPEWAMVMGGVMGARPPYCSGAAPCAGPRLGPRTALARWCGLARWLRPPREQAAGGAGARGVQVEPNPPPPRRGPFWGRGDVLSAPGGRKVAPVTLKLGGGGRGGGADGGGAPPPPAPPPRWASACHPLSPARPPGVYSCRGGCRAAVGVGRGPVCRQWVSAAGGGGRGGEPPCPGSRPRLPQAGL